MITLITTTEDIKAANSAITYNLDFDSIRSFVDDASLKYIQPVIGADTYARLNSESAELWLQAADLARKAEANFAIALYTNFGSVKLGENGAMVYQDEKYRIASDKKVAALVNQAMADGYLTLECLVDHLEKNRQTFVEYAQSNARKNNRRRFINSTEEFDAVLFINKNATLFNSLKGYITDAEIEHIEPLLGEDFTEDLRKKVTDNNCSALEEDLLLMVGRAVAHYAIASAIPYRAVNVDTNGLFTNTPIFSAGGGNTESQQGIDVNRITLAMAAALSHGSKALTKLRKFINKNQSQFTGANTIDLDSRTKPGQVDGGIFFV